VPALGPRAAWRSANSLLPGFGFADYLLYVDGRACGVIEAKKSGATLTGVEAQSARYAQGLPPALPAWRRPLPFVYESTGIETHFTNGLDPAPRARPVFAFHRPDTLADWLAQASADPPVAPATVLTTDGAPPGAQVERRTGTMLARLQAMPPLVTEWGDFKLWPAQIVAIRNLERSLAANKPRALIQMATGSGKTFTAISFIYRLIVRRRAAILFLVDRGTSAGRPEEFDQYVSPVNNYKFGEESSSAPDEQPARQISARVHQHHPAHVSMLKGRELPEEPTRNPPSAESLFDRAPEPIAYNPAFPIETFDIIVTDEAHRARQPVRQVLSTSTRT
jgi:type I restriction enzyme R subunit